MTNYLNSSPKCTNCVPDPKHIVRIGCAKVVFCPSDYEYKGEKTFILCDRWDEFEQMIYIDDAIKKAIRTPWRD